MIPIVKNTDPIGKSEIILLVKWKGKKRKETKTGTIIIKSVFPSNVFTACALH